MPTETENFPLTWEFFWEINKSKETPNSKNWVKSETKANLERQKKSFETWQKIKAEQEKIIEQKFLFLSQNPEYKEIIWDKKYNELTLGDFYSLSNKWLNLWELFLSKKELLVWWEYIVNLGQNKQIEAVIGANFVLPKEVQEVEFAWIKYVRTPEGFLNKDSENPFLLLQSGQKLKITKIQIYTDFEEEKKQNELRYKKQRQQESQELILNSVKKWDKEIKLPSSNKEDIAVALNTFWLLFTGIFKLFGLDKLFNSKFWTIKLDGKVGETIKKHEQELDLNKQIPFDRVFGSWIKRSSSGTTLCARTAREDAANIFGVKLPAGNAIDVQNSYKTTNKEFESSWENNFADIFTGSKSKYGHRLIGFKKWWEWFVLDPYPTGWINYPIKLDDYEKNVCKRMWRPIKKVVLYKSEKSVV